MVASILQVRAAVLSDYERLVKQLQNRLRCPSTRRPKPRTVTIRKTKADVHLALPRDVGTTKLVWYPALVPLVCDRIAYALALWFDFKEDAMSSTTQPVKVLLMKSASDYAFRVGQLANTILIQRATGIAKEQNRDTITITEDHIRNSLDASIVKEILARLEDNQDDGETEGRRLSA
jgi:hypothetical protein